MQESEQKALEEDLQEAVAKEQMLLNELMQKEQAIEHQKQLQENNHKEIGKIKQSRTWRMTAPFRALIPRFRQKIREQDIEIAELRHELKEAKSHLGVLEERLRIETKRRDNNELFSMLREAKASGDMMRLLENMIQVKQQNRTHFNNAFKYIANLYKTERADYRNMIYHKMLSAMDPEDIPEVIVRSAMAENPIDLKEAASFRKSLTARQRQNQLSGPLPEWRLEDKEHSFQFMDMLEVKRPWTSDESYQASSLPEEENVVIKPVNGAGSRGVYLVFTIHDIIDVKRAQRLTSRQQLMTNMAKDLEMCWVTHDEWVMEELIYENEQEKIPARDIKCYCFYGQVALILEIIRSPELKNCWWRVDGTRMRTGKYDEDLFRGNGITQEELERAASISSEIPAPFIRIDFLKGEHELVFGEFTPKPGNYEAFDDDVDKNLGDYFLAAEVRLTEDLLKGKEFQSYKRWVSEHKA